MFPVRDTFIDVNEENISPAEIKNFEKRPYGDAEVHRNGSVDHRGTPHDVGHTGGEKNFSYSITIIKPAFKLRNAKTQIILQFCLGLNKKMLSYRKALLKDSLLPPRPSSPLRLDGWRVQRPGRRRSSLTSTVCLMSPGLSLIHLLLIRSLIW